MRWSERPPAAHLGFASLVRFRSGPCSPSVAVAHLILVRSMTRSLLLVAAVVAITHVAAARGITSEELLGTWLMGPTEADKIYGTFRSDHSYTILHGEHTWAHGRWKLSDDGKKLQMIIESNSSSRDVTIIRYFDGRLLHITVSNGVQGAWQKIRQMRNSKHGSAKT